MPLKYKIIPRQIGPAYYQEKPVTPDLSIPSRPPGQRQECSLKEEPGVVGNASRGRSRSISTNVDVAIAAHSSTSHDTFSEALLDDGRVFTVKSGGSATRDLGTAAEHREVYTDGRNTPKGSSHDRAYVNMDDLGEQPLKKRVKLNICGLVFETYQCTLQEYPQTLLGSDDIETFFDSEKKEYFFDRNRESFSYILNFYQTGRLYAPSHVPPDIFEAEREFYKINLALKQKSAIQNGTKKIVKKRNMWQKLANRIWKFLNNPKSSKPATIWAWLDIVFIMISVTCLIVETLPDIKRKVADLDSLEYQLLFTLDTICVGFFTFDLVSRCITAPDKKAFFMSLMAWLDFLAILPYFVLLCTEESNNTIEILRVLRLARVLRVFKLVRRSKKLLLIAHVMKKSTSELSLLVMVWLMAVVVFGSFLYYAENEKNPKISSILGACWWAVATMSTVGYGDVYPTTTWGKVIGTIVVFLSMIFLALPLTIIVSTFSKTYRARKCLTAENNSDEDDSDNEERSDENSNEKANDV